MSIDLRTPWSIAPLQGKYYGTEILDRDGNVLFKIWEIPWGTEGAEPSAREEQVEICDSHFESQQSWWMANAIIQGVNNL